MDQLINNKHKINFLLSNDTSSIQPTQSTVKKHKTKKCNGCKRIRQILQTSDLSHLLQSKGIKNKRKQNY
jgi:hypothetical protein